MSSSTQNSSRRTRTRADYHYFLTYRTRWSDNDQFAHVNNSVYHHLIDSIVSIYLGERCGCSSPSPSTPIGLVVSTYCEFFAPISFPEIVTLGLRVVKLGRSSAEYEVGFFSEPEPEPEDELSNAKEGKERIEETAKAVGGNTHVFVDRMHRRPVKEMNTTLKSGLEAIFSDPSKKAKL